MVDFAVLIILCGDFNIVFDRFFDRVGLVIDDVFRESILVFIRFFEFCCVVDIWRCFYFVVSVFIWFRWDGLFFLRIDFVGCFYFWIVFV